MWSDFYTDTFTTVGSIEKEDTDGSTSMIEGEILKDVQCRISFKANDKNDSKSIDGNFKSIILKIFTDNTIKVAKGDFVKANRIINNTIVESYEGIAGEPVIHEDHLEFILEDNKGA